MTWWEAILLGTVQGLTEFIPVSSSGHLVLGQELLGLRGDSVAGVTFEIFVHFGTVISILTVYRQEVVNLLNSSLGLLRERGRVTEQYDADRDLRTVFYIFVTLIPTGLVYIAFKDPLEAAFSQPLLVCGMLYVTGILLLLTLIRPNPDGELSLVKSFMVGVAQSAAMIPGISRSGATICAAMYQNVERERAANFSFLMLLPVVLGATLIKGVELVQAGSSADWMPVLIGMVAAYLSGIVGIRVVLRFVTRGKLQYFAYYCFAIATIGVVVFGL